MFRGYLKWFSKKGKFFGEVLLGVAQNLQMIILIK